MENIILTYGLSNEQFDLLKAAVPEYYALEKAKTVADFMATNTVCNVILAEELSQESLNVLLSYYLDTLDVIAERVVWIGAAELPIELQHLFVCYDTFRDMLLNIEQIIKQAQSHYDIQQMYLCPFAYLPGRGIEHVLEQDIFNSLHKKYGPKPDPDIQKRLRQEWTALLETNATNELAAVYELCLWLKQNNHPFRVTGEALSGLIPYLLGITDINPLEVHYHCSRCHHFEWGYAGWSPFDLKKKTCPECELEMERDGHDLIWQEFCSFGRMPCYNIYLPEDIQPLITNWAEYNWINKLHPGEWEVQCLEKRLFWGNIFFGFELNRTEISETYHSRIITADDKEMLIQEGPHKEMLEKIHLPIEIDFSDYVALLCIEDQNETIKNLAYLFGLNRACIFSDEFPYCRESVFYYLKTHGFIDKDAFRGMTSVRKGKGLPVITEEMSTADDSWIVEYCAQVKRMPSRAEIISNLFFNLKCRQEDE